MAILLMRKSISSGISGVNVARKDNDTHGLIFAPSWDLVLRWRRFALTKEEYTVEYMEILKARTKEDWEWLASCEVNDKIVLLCYCRDEQFCHTQLIIDYAVQNYPHLFRREE